MLIHLDNDWFLKIKNGYKTIELRLFDEKRRKLKIGDIIIFENRQDNEQINCKVVKLHLFNNFKELYNELDNSTFGYDSNTIISYIDMEKFYSIEDQEKYGVVGIEIELIK